jgi:tetratricopeptide (TPR) repeat protein
MERIAPGADRLSELLATYEERAVLVGLGERAAVLMCRAAHLCERHDRLNDVERYLARALEFSDGDPALFEQIEMAAKAFGRGALRQMVKVYESAAAASEEQPRVGAAFLFRAAELLRTDLEDSYEAFRFLKDALVLDPANEAIAEVLEEIAVQRSFVPLLDAFLEERIAETLSDTAAAVLLERRARILHERLGKPSEAADAYLRLWALRPSDANVLARLRMCLLETDRVHELISAYDRELARRKDPAERADLLRDIAELWENGAKNVWEARDAWKRLLRLVPNDPEALAAIARIERSRSQPPPDPGETVLDEDDLLE